MKDDASSNDCISNYLQLNSDIHSYNTRIRDNFSVPYFRRSASIKALSSNHDAVFCSVPQNTPVRNTPKRIKFKDDSNYSLNAFKSKVAEGLNLFHLYYDFSIDDKLKIFFNIILNAYNSTCKIRENNISTKKQTSP